MKRTTVALLGTLALLAGATCARAAIEVGDLISIDIDEGSGDDTTNGPAGPLGTGTPFWNGADINGTTGSFDVFDQDGNDTAVDISFENGEDRGGFWGRNEWSQDDDNTPSGVLDDAVFENWPRHGDGGNKIGVRFKGFTPGTYKVAWVVLERDGNDVPNSRNWTLWTATDGMDDGSGGLDTSTGTHWGMDDWDNGGASWVAAQAGLDDGNTWNYIDEGTVSITSTDQWLSIVFGADPDGRGAGPTALQLEMVPEPATLALLGLGGLGVLLRRKRR